MDDHEVLESPRKKQRLDNTDLSYPNPHTSITPGMASNPEDTGFQSSHDAQLSREAEVGITEFVSPDLPGFVGVLKKR